MTHRQARMNLNPLSTATRVLLASGAVWLGACTSTELDVPLNHPGHAQARAGRVAQTQALTAAYALENSATTAAADGGNEHAHHDHGPAPARDHGGRAAQDHGAPAAQDHGAPAAQDQGKKGQASASAGGAKPAATAVFTCPMHPEIIRKEAGSCPICGMKLVPKKDAK